MKKFCPENKAVIMCGISGSGKTHYARQLEKEGYIRLSSDHIIWEKVGSNLFSLPNDKQKQLFTECRAEILRNMVTLLESGEKVVVDATNCKRSIRDEIRRLCAEVKVKPLFVYCNAEKEVMWQRLSKRKGEEPDDLLVNRQQFLEYWNGFECPQDSETDFIFLNME